MSFKLDDRVLWLGFGAFAVVAAKAIHYALTDIQRLTEADPDTQKSQQQAPDQRSPEDLSVETLGILASSTNADISNAAKELIAKRVAKHPLVCLMIQREASSTDLEIQRRAQTGLAFLEERCDSGPIISWGRRSGESDDELVRTSYVGESRLASAESQDVAGEYHSDSGLIVSGLAADDAPTLDWRTAFELPSEENPVAGWTDVPRERPLRGEERAEETRRRRREAMVMVPEQMDE